jgi:hypothetical protein
METSTSALRKTSYALWGVSGATALTGTVFALLANSNYQNYKRDYSMSGGTHAIRAETDPIAAQKLKDRIGVQKTVSIISFSVAAAAAIGGTTLFFLAPEWQAAFFLPPEWQKWRMAKEVKVGVLPMQGGAVVSLQGLLP